MTCPGSRPHLREKPAEYRCRGARAPGAETGKEKVEINADALTLAYKELEEAINEYRQTYKERLENQASAYCQNISSRPGRTVKMDDSFNIGILEDGRHCTVEQISKGGPGSAVPLAAVCAGGSAGRRDKTAP